jgi:hypothetical protein
MPGMDRRKRTGARRRLGGHPECGVTIRASDSQAAAARTNDL